MLVLCFEGRKERYLGTQGTYHLKLFFETPFLGPAFGRTDFSRIFIFEPPDFFADFLAGFFLLIFVGKSAQKNPPGKSPGKSSKIYTTNILQHISADCPGQPFPRTPDEGQAKRRYTKLLVAETSPLWDPPNFRPQFLKAAPDIFAVTDGSVVCLLISKLPSDTKLFPGRNYIRPPPLPPISARRPFSERGGGGVYILEPPAAGFYTPPLFYTPPHP